MFSGSIDRLIDKATSQLLLEPDWASIMMICDLIRQCDTQPKHVIAPLKKKISQENPHVTMFALGVLESIIKNCGTPVHDEIATKEFMEYVKDVAKNRPDPVKGKLLEMIQVWSHAFRSVPSYKIVQDTYNLMKMEGCQFPALKEADALFQSERAPDWKEGDSCHRCRVQFSMVQRKHHCRNCGQIFCAKCSSKSSIIPKYGIEKEVRVCISCYDTLNVKSASSGSKEEGDLPAEYLASPLAKQPQGPPSRSEQEIQEAEELELAIALSKSEVEAQSNTKTYKGSSSVKNTSSDRSVDNYTSAVVTAPELDTSDMDPELAHYLNRNYWQQKQQDSNNVVDNNAATVTTTTPSAPVAMSDPVTSTNLKVTERFQNGADTGEESAFQKALASSIDVFVNRMMSDHQRGRSIYTDSSVQTLFETINKMHPQLIDATRNLEDQRAYYEGLQDKLAQLKDAREALDALRDEHREKRRLEAEEAERQRQIALAQKLDVMRQKKQEYLEYQRQLALQRMHEQERELAQRLEHQKQYQYQISMYGHQYPVPAGMAPGVNGSPHHQPYPPSQYPQQVPYGNMPQQQVPVGPPGQPIAGQPIPGQTAPGQPIPGQNTEQSYGATPGSGAYPPNQMPPTGTYPPGGQYPVSQSQMTPPTQGQVQAAQLPPQGQLPANATSSQAVSQPGQIPPQGQAVGHGQMSIQHNPVPAHVQDPVHGYMPPGAYNGNVPPQPHPGQPYQPQPLPPSNPQEYNAYNMQNMGAALPGMPGFNAPPGGPTTMQPGAQNMDAGAPGQPPTQPPVQGQQNEAQLISFE